jgi:hypothetical protein
MAQADSSPGNPGPLCTIAGTVRSSRSYLDTYGERVHATLIAATPEPSGARGLFEVFSGQPLGQTGASVEVRCRVRGVPHSYNLTDDATGERRKVQTARHFLAAV